MGLASGFCFLCFSSDLPQSLFPSSLPVVFLPHVLIGPHIPNRYSRRILACSRKAVLHGDSPPHNNKERSTTATMQRRSSPKEVKDAYHGEWNDGTDWSCWISLEAGEEVLDACADDCGPSWCWSRLQFPTLHLRTETLKSFLTWSYLQLSQTQSMHRLKPYSMILVWMRVYNHQIYKMCQWCFLLCFWFSVCLSFCWCFFFLTRFRIDN